MSIPTSPSPREEGLTPVGDRAAARGRLRMGRTARGLLLGGLALLALAGWWHHRSVERRILIMRNDSDLLLANPKARSIALRDGRRVYLAHCASCHGDRGRADPTRAMPDLTDDDFLYGSGKVSEIEQIVLHGIRAGDTKGWNLAEMPGYAKRVPYSREPLPWLEPAQIDALIAFLRAANGHPDYPQAAVDQGRVLFTTTAGCWDCHGHDALGDPAIGAPNLADGKWLKGNGTEADIRVTLERGLAGVSPAFQHILSPYDARVASAYVASLHPPAK